MGRAKAARCRLRRHGAHPLRRVAARVRLHRMRCPDAYRPPNAAWAAQPAAQHTTTGDGALNGAAPARGRMGHREIGFWTIWQRFMAQSGGWQSLVHGGTQCRTQMHSHSKRTMAHVHAMCETPHVPPPDRQVFKTVLVRSSPQSNTESIPRDRSDQPAKSPVSVHEIHPCSYMAVGVRDRV